MIGNTPGGSDYLPTWNSRADAVAAAERIAEGLYPQELLILEIKGKVETTCFVVSTPK